MKEREIKKHLDNLLLEIENAENPKQLIKEYGEIIKTAIQNKYEIPSKYTEKNRELTNKYILKLIKLK